MNDIELKAKALRDAGYTEGELSIDPYWYIIWEPENIRQYNVEYELEKYAPGFIAFGSNGGNELLVVDECGTVFSLPAIGMDPQFAKRIAGSIDVFETNMEKCP